NAHDFLTDARCRAAPYGLFDVLANKGHVVVGTSADTPWFAAEAVTRWWSRIGCHRYRGVEELLLLADGGGSNGYRPRLWKKGLQELLVDRYGLQVTVCHYPTGASKWNGRNRPPAMRPSHSAAPPFAGTDTIVGSLAHSSSFEIR